ncbi:hypothetical protein B0T09DRAFT_319084 [Sordaria sp. MPI-SDFR-AT-0083]|nr:hypothetical protein B0T09DRAFT_319084 [Sordaria sp. MPI-SDFR-AT-0083]
MFTKLLLCDLDQLSDLLHTRPQTTTRHPGIHTMVLGPSGLSTILLSANRSGPADRAVTGVDGAGVRLTDRIFAMSAYSSTNGENSLVILVIAGRSLPQIAQRTNDMHQSPLDTRI